MRKSLQMLFVLGALSTLAAAESHAQERTYVPARPTISPYLRLSGPNGGGGVSNYFNYVRPAIRQNQINRAQAQTIRRQTIELQALEAETVQLRDGQISPTGTGSTFMNYSHYFPQAGQQPGTAPLRR